MTLSKSYNFSETLFPQLQNGSNDPCSAYLNELSQGACESTLKTVMALIRLRLYWLGFCHP